MKDYQERIFVRSFIFSIFVLAVRHTHIQLDSSYFRSAVKDGKHISLW